MDAVPTCAAEAQDQTTTTLLVILSCSNVVLLFLVGLLLRRLEKVHRKVIHLLKRDGPPRSTSKQYLGGYSPRPPSPANLSSAATSPLRPAPRIPSPQPASLPGETRMRRTPSNDSMRSSMSGDDFASLQYMLGDEGGVG